MQWLACRYFLVAAAQLLVAWAAPAVAQTPPNGIGSAVHQDLIRVAATGAVLGVVARDGVRWIGAFGVTQLDGDDVMHPREKMHLGTFGDFLLAGLAAEMGATGAVDLDMPIERLYPAVTPGLGVRTLNPLLMHTGGLDASPLVSRPRGTSPRRQAVEVERQFLNDQVIMLPADVIRSPSPHHTLLAGAVLQARGGGSLQSAFRTYLLRPAGVAEVSFAPEGGSPPGVRSGFQVRLAPGEPYGTAPFPEPSVLQPQHRIWAHALDFSRILKYLVFEMAGRQVFLAPQVPDPFDAPCAGVFSLGFRWDAVGRGRSVGEGPGYTTEVRFIPLGSGGMDDGVVIFALANGGASTLDRALDALEDWVVGFEQNDVPRYPLPVSCGGSPPEPSVVGPALAGRYRNGSEILHLTWADGVLGADLGIGTQFPVRAGNQGELEAYLPDGRAALRFRVAIAGTATVLLTNGIAFVRDAPPGGPPGN